MRSHVEFRAPVFVPPERERDEVNPGLYGHALAAWVQGELAARGFSTSDPIAEDWGWLVPVENPAFPTWVGCGNYAEWDDGFLCFIEPSRPTVRRGMRKVDTTDFVERLASALDEALRANPDVRQMRWWTEDELPRR